MKDTYDFSTARRNPYPAKLKKPVSIRLDADVIDYFKSLADDTGIPYQTLINLYLREYAQTGKQPSLKWRKPA
ncbi:MAG: BrnA antitoxin family protein [Planctomycetota bacterium]